MSRNTASETGQISLSWIKRLKKRMMVVMASRSLSTASKRACDRMTAERAVHLAFRNWAGAPCELELVFLIESAPLPHLWRFRFSHL
jgi:hypothetical protein